jgi:hypothetical protein
MFCHCFYTVLSSCLIAFGFCLYFLPHFIHLLYDLYSFVTGALSISKWACPAISICYSSILDYFSIVNLLSYHSPILWPNKCSAI